MSTPTPERSVEEIVDELFHFFKENPFKVTQMKEKTKQTLQAER